MCGLRKLRLVLHEIGSVRSRSAADVAEDMMYERIAARILTAKEVPLHVLVEYDDTEAETWGLKDYVLDKTSPS